jgi:predicted AAA+ superfamily ATPase
VKYEEETQHANLLEVSFVHGWVFLGLVLRKHFMHLDANEALVAHTSRFVDVQASNGGLLGGARPAKHESTVTTMMSSVRNSEENFTFVTFLVIRVSSPHGVTA